MTFDVPKFTDGEILSAQALYKLAHLSLQFFRWNCIAGKKFGFFAPTQAYDLWNKFSLDGQTLEISNLFVISEQGYPFIVEQPQKVPVSGSSLYAVMNLARNSQSDRKSGYCVDFHWDLLAQDLEQEEVPVIKLGEVEDTGGDPAFRLILPVIGLDSTSDLWEKASQFQTVIRSYRSHLVKHSQTDSIKGEEFIYSVDRLCNISRNTKTATFIDDVSSLLQWAGSFYDEIGQSIDSEIFDSCFKIVHNRTPEINSHRVQCRLLDKMVKLFHRDELLWKPLVTRVNTIPCSDKSQWYDNTRKIYRYDLAENQHHGDIVIKFKGRPTDLDFAFSEDRELPEERQTLERNKIEERGGILTYSVSTSPSDRYLFIVAPHTTNMTVEGLTP